MLFRVLLCYVRAYPFLYYWLQHAHHVLLSASPCHYIAPLDSKCRISHSVTYAYDVLILRDRNKSLMHSESAYVKLCKMYL